MKNIFGSRIFCFLLGAIIFGSISVFAYQITSKDISFTPTNSNWNVSNIQDAINDLYKDINKLVVGEYFLAIASPSGISSLGVTLYTDEDYLTHDSSSLNVTVKKAGKYTIEYSLTDATSHSSIPNYILKINNVNKSSLTHNPATAGKVSDSITLDLNENDLISSYVAGGGGSSQTVFNTKIIYNGE